MKAQAIYFILSLTLLTGCKDKLAPVSPHAIQPLVVTEQTVFDTDDPAIWINNKDQSQRLIIGTDKEKGGGLYAFDLEGKIVAKYTDMARPNNVDIAYNFPYKNDTIDIAVVTERKANAIRIFKLPELTPIDGGGLKVFEGETAEEYNEPMGISLYTKKDSETPVFYAIVGRKNGPVNEYLWQYAFAANEEGKIELKLARKFGAYSGKKEIEAIAVDQELGYVYYSDETAGVRKYYADPVKGNEELAFFVKGDAKRDHEGIAIYKKDATTGYIVLSNQQDNSILVYPREGEPTNPHQHQLITTIPVAAIECDGLEITSVPLDPKFPKGMLVMMSNGKVFHYYDWNIIQTHIDKAQK
ncbi:phytase [Myroides sp. DF42-4-2]|uniref:phytase n=1 Tax=unclassified Myroides TaxID=2642485 RepID=UPI0025755514|nr:phytase [Myroides sp. DF42-4-2]MDM1408112.1 phytase [Myroides sp. DF42-4-2]